MSKLSKNDNLLLGCGDANLAMEKKIVIELDVSMHNYNIENEDVIQYNGEVCPITNLPDGEGSLMNKDKVILLAGNFKDNKICGFTKAFYQSSQVSYEGYWKDNAKNGFGESYTEDGNKKYEGKYLDNLPHGKGILYHDLDDQGPNLLVNNTIKAYEGDFKYGLANGYGTCYNFYGGIIYEGEYNCGIRDGKGTSFFSFNGFTNLKCVNYEGSWKNDEKDGYGVIYNMNSKPLYKGEWKSGLKNGYGIDYYDLGVGNEDLVEYEGNWLNGYWNGRGIKHELHSKITIDGYWYNNCLCYIYTKDNDTYELYNEKDNFGGYLLDRKDRLKESLLRLVEDNGFQENIRFDNLGNLFEPLNFLNGTLYADDINPDYPKFKLSSILSKIDVINNEVLEVSSDTEDLKSQSEGMVEVAEEEFKKKISKRKKRRKLHILDKNKKIYFGEINQEKGLENGDGVLYNKHKGVKVYEGEWLLGKRNGIGKSFNHIGKLDYIGGYDLNEKKASGSSYGMNGKLCYQGDWSHNYPQGFGTLYDNSGAIINTGFWNTNP